MKSSMLAIFLLSTILCSGQTIKVKAEQGDGIFSLLRKQGLNPGKYYVDFIQLNEALIKNGSELSLGVEYQIPIEKQLWKFQRAHVRKRQFLMLNWHQSIQKAQN